MFRKIKDIISSFNIRKINLHYDKKSDVLYISFGNPKPCMSIEVGDGIVVRKTPTGELNGITIIDYKKRTKE